MSGIRGSDTRPEMLVRRQLHALGFRYRLHDRKLPGKPDIVLPRYSAAILVNGCFWHRHNCHLFKWPKSRPEFWRAKIQGNVERDIRNMQALKSSGWRVGVIWECALKGRTRKPPDVVATECAIWLRGTDPELEIRGDE